MIEKIQEKIDKYEVLERGTSNPAKFNLIGEFLCDLGRLLENAKEKKKACCEKKTTQVDDKTEERWIRVITCRNCPHISDSRLLIEAYCTIFPGLCPSNLDVIHPQCPLDKTPTRRKAGLK